METRLLKLRKTLVKHRADALLISSASHVHYLTGQSNFSPIEREVYLLITKKKNYILTDGRYSEAVRKQIKHFELVELGAGIPMAKLFKNLVKNNRITHLGIEENNLTVGEHQFFSRLVKQTKGVSIEALRVIKENWEVKHIEEACRLGDRTFNFILKKLKPGVTEAEIAWEMEMFVRDQGHAMSFDTIVAFGKNSSVPHHHTGQAKLQGKKGEFILLDFVTKVNGYCSDMTRTVFYGAPSEKQKKIYKTVFEAQKHAAKYIQANIKRPKAAEADKITRAYIEKQGYPSIPHSLGHGIGLEVHELPRLSTHSSDILEEGMVFSIEPGIYLPGFGGVRIEDLYTIEKGGLRQLTRARQSVIEL